MRNFFLPLLFASLLASGEAASAQSLAGRRAPSFSLPDSNQVQHDILDYRGKWLILTFTTSMGCTHCAPLVKALEPLQSKMAVLNVMISPPETAVTATRFASENKTTSPIVFDQSQVAIGYFKATPTNSRIDTPHVFIINPAGNIVEDWPDGKVATILAGKGGVAGALQTVMSTSK
jgi:peroxiredoxin Q/BCP